MEDQKNIASLDHVIESSGDIEVSVDGGLKRPGQALFSSHNPQIIPETCW